jgi:hypothetical protein
MLLRTVIPCDRITTCRRQDTWKRPILPVFRVKLPLCAPDSHIERLERVYQLRVSHKALGRRRCQFGDGTVIDRHTFGRRQPRMVEDAVDGKVIVERLAEPSPYGVALGAGGVGGYAELEQPRSAQVDGDERSGSRHFRHGPILEFIDVEHPAGSPFKSIPDDCLGDRRSNIAGDVDKPERVIWRRETCLPKTHAKRSAGVGFRHYAQVCGGAERSYQFRDNLRVQPHG